MQDQTKADKDAVLDNIICKIKLKLIRIQKKKDNQNELWRRMRVRGEDMFSKILG